MVFQLLGPLPCSVQLSHGLCPDTSRDSADNGVLRVDSIGEEETQRWSEFVDVHAAGEEVLNEREAVREREGKLAQRISYMTRAALLIIDEVGYLPIQPGGANLFFQLINARYERGAIILTSNRGFGEWGEVFGDTVVAAALLDRLLHHAIVVEIAGSSYRLREHAKLVPDNLRLPPISAPVTQRRKRGRPRKKEAS